MKICILSAFEDSMLRDTGASVRIYNLSKSLSNLGNNVILVIPTAKPFFERIDGVKVHALRGFFPLMLLSALSKLIGVKRPTTLFFYDPWFIHRAIQVLRDSDIVQVEQLSANALFLPIIAKVLRKPIIIDCHDTFQALRTQNVGILRKILETFFERRLYKLAKTVVVVSENEKHLLISVGVMQNSIEIVPNGVNTREFTSSVDKSKLFARYGLGDSRSVIFVGNMEYEPNREAVNLIASIIAPTVEATFENAKFVIVGRRNGLEFPNLIFTGVVENVAEVISASDVGIVPLLHGSGTRLKILEYFSCSLPVISTSIGVEGLRIRNGVQAIIEDDIHQFALWIIRLLKNRALSEELGKSARHFVVDNYDWTQVTEHLNTIYCKTMQKI